MLWSNDLECERVNAGCVDANSLLGSVDVEVSTEVANFSRLT